MFGDIIVKRREGGRRRRKEKEGEGERKKR